MTKKEYYEKLKNHDWFYEFSDDHSVYTSGLASLQKLRSEARGNPALQEMFDSYYSYVFSGSNFGTEKKECPAAPEDE